ncbi:hypothetical protein DL93DRAFT_2100674 [Clavulina sp. PMI_390]|nr:hypothetical protein DL93DRAFT_2100674 [Clavulina sp. PMI_390]
MIQFNGDSSELDYPCHFSNEPRRMSSVSRRKEPPPSPKTRRFRRKRLSDGVRALQVGRDANADRPINRLPVEVLSYIFELATDELRDAWPSEAIDDVRLVVTGVCSWWRAIALSNPNLWGLLVYQDNDEVTLWSHRWTLLCLSRSGDTDLDVSISTLVERASDETDDDGESDYSDGLGDQQFARILSFMTTLRPMWHRVASVIIQIQSWASIDAILPLPDAGPKLQHIDLDVLVPRPRADRETLRIFPPEVQPETIAQHYPNLESLKLAVTQLTPEELERIVLCLPSLRSLQLQDEDSTRAFDIPTGFLLPLPLLHELVLVDCPFPSTVFAAPALQLLTYDLPSSTSRQCGGFWPDSLPPAEDLSPTPSRLTVGDVRSAADFFEPAVHLIRWYNRVETLTVRGREAIGRLLAAAFGASSTGANGAALIVAPDAKPFTGLTAPPTLRTLEIIGWDSTEAQQALVQLPDPQELTELSEVLLELLGNSPELGVKWLSLHDPTSIDHEAFIGVRKACEEMMAKFGSRVSLQLA